MLAVVKKRPIEFIVRGNIPDKYIALLQKDFGAHLTMVEEKDEYVLATEMDWYKEIKAEETPGATMRFYRTLQKMTQVQLAGKLGCTKQKVSNMEHNLKPVSKKTAYQLAAIFKKPPGRFI
jgi:DNA-binding XRE family transcriptional regulator